MVEEDANPFNNDEKLLIEPACELTAAAAAAAAAINANAELLLLLLLAAAVTAQVAGGAIDEADRFDACELGRDDEEALLLFGFRFEAR